MSITTIGLIIVLSSLSLSFIVFGIYTLFDGKPKNYIRKPSSRLNNRKR